MTRTALIASALLAATASGTPADAAKQPAPLCRQIQDPTGDAQLLGTNNPSGQPQVASLDVVSADFATTPKQVLATIRLLSLSAHPATALGSTYKVTWKVKEVTQSLSYRTFADAAPDAVFDADTEAGTILDLIPAGFSVDVPTSSITLSLARKSDAALRTTGGSVVKFTGISVQTYGGVSRKNGASLSGYDNATQAKAYVDRTPTCVKGA